MGKKLTADKTRARRVIPSEAALVLAMLLTSLGVILLTKSNTGLAAINLISYVLSSVFPVLSLGTCSFLVQASIMLTLVAVMRRIKAGYLISFLISLLMGVLIDMYNALLSGLPVTAAYRIGYFAAGFWILSLGIFLLNSCMIPTMPYETFTRDITERFSISYRRLRTLADIFFLGISALIGYLATGSFIGIGIGSLLMVLLGSAVSLWGRLFSKRYIIKPRIRILEKLSR